MKVEKFALIAILILGFFLRFWGISSVYMRIDDVAVAKTIITVYNGYWIADPIFFYPPLLYYICAIVLRGISLFLSLIFFHKEPGLYQFTLSQVLFVSRLISAFFGFFTIPFLYLSLKKLYSEKTALLGIFIFSISFIHIIHSHQLVMDILSTFFVVLCFYFSTLILSSGKIIYYILAGLSAGLSVSSKYNGIISIFVIITAHFLREGRLSIPIIFNPKLILSGIFSITGFFISHPFSLIRFKAFINSSKFFYNVVHKTEWYLVPIKPKGIIENIKYSKYFQGVSNLLSGEGLLIFFLILSGFLFLLILGKRGNLLLLSFPILYFLFFLPLLGFSRYRDLTFLSPFYSAIPAVSISLIYQRLKNKKFKVIFLISFILLFLMVTFDVFSKVYLIWDDDTSQIMYRWLLRNIEEGKYIGNEWFTIPIEDGQTPFKLHTAPYIFRREFPPYEQFDLILSSSLCYSHFFKNKKFYSYEISFYKKLERHELLKEFFNKEIEYKNPTIKLYNGKNMKRKGVKLFIPDVPYPLKIPREFEIVDGSQYGKETKSFFLREGEKIERIFISRKPIKKFYIFFIESESDGFVKIRNFIKSKKLKIERGKNSYFIIKPSLSLPFKKYRYSLRFSALKGMKKVFVKIIYDEEEAGFELHQLGFLKEGNEILKKVKGKRHEIKLYIKKIEGGNNFLEKKDKLMKIYMEKDKEKWKRNFKKITGLDPELLEESKTIKLESEKGEWKGGGLIESENLSGKKGIFLPLHSLCNISFPDFFLYRGIYKVNLYFKTFRPNHQIDASIIIENRDGNETFDLRESKLTKDGKYSVAEIIFEIKYHSSVNLKMMIKNGNESIFDFLKISPSLHDIFVERGKELIF